MRLDLVDCLFRLHLRPMQIIIRLQADPDIGGRTEVARQTKRHVRTDASLFVQDLIDRPERGLKRLRQLYLGDPQRRKEILLQNLAGMGRRPFQVISGHFNSP